MLNMYLFVNPSIPPKYAVSDVVGMIKGRVSYSLYIRLTSFEGGDCNVLSNILQVLNRNNIENQLIYLKNVINTCNNVNHTLHIK
jgi:hypothetical protein